MRILKYKKKGKIGSLHHKAKLTEEDAMHIRHSTLSRKELSKRYGISQCNISKIKNNKIWTHI